MKDEAVSNPNQYSAGIPEGVSGDWRVERYDVTPESERFQELRYMFNPQRLRRVVPVGTYTRLVRNDVTIMSDTPDEIRDHARAVLNARGHCLVAGLGLGVVVGMMLEKPEVTRMTVLELGRDVIKLVGSHIKKVYGNRLEIIRTDALTWKPPKGATYGCAWFDIFDSICENNLSQMMRLKRRFRGRALWMGCWQEDGCKAQRDRIRKGGGWY